MSPEPRRREARHPALHTSRAAWHLSEGIPSLRDLKTGASLGGAAPRRGRVCPSAGRRIGRAAKRRVGFAAGREVVACLGGCSSKPGLLRAPHTGGQRIAWRRHVFGDAKGEVTRWAGHVRPGRGGRPGVRARGLSRDRNPSAAPSFPARGSSCFSSFFQVFRKRCLLLRSLRKQTGAF